MKALRTVLFGSIVFLFSINIVFAEGISKEAIRTACKKLIELGYAVGESNPYSPTICRSATEQVKALYLKKGYTWDEGLNLSVDLLEESCHCGQTDKATGKYSLPILLKIVDIAIDGEYY